MANHFGLSVVGFIAVVHPNAVPVRSDDKSSSASQEDPCVHDEAKTKIHDKQERSQDIWPYIATRFIYKAFSRTAAVAHFNWFRFCEENDCWSSQRKGVWRSSPLVESPCHPFLQELISTFATAWSIIMESCFSRDCLYFLAVLSFSKCFSCRVYRSQRVSRRMRRQRQVRSHRREPTIWRRTPHQTTSNGQWCIVRTHAQDPCVEYENLDAGSVWI